MYIISKFHDYYDSCTSFGIDKSVVYNRSNTKVRVLTKFYHQDKEYTRNRDQQRIVYGDILGIKYIGPEDTIWSIVSMPKMHRADYAVGALGGGCILFCGKYYPFISIDDDVCYTPESIELKLKSYPKLSDFYHRPIPKYSISTPTSLSFRKVCVDNWFLEYARINEKSNDDIHRNHGAPIIVIYDTSFGSTYIELNPMLSKFQFYKCIDTYTAYQALYMYISGVLGCGEKDIIDIDNESRIEKHGFDKVTSFRKEKTKKRK